MTLPAPSETSDQPPPSFRLGFRQPAGGLSDQIPSPVPSPVTDQELPPDPFDGPASDPASPPGEPSPDESGPTSSPGSSRAANPLIGKGLRDVCRNGVIIASDQAHRFLARTPGQQEVQLYLADAADAESIGDPLARIAGRRQALGEVSEDTADLMAAMMGFLGYGAKQINKRAIASKIDERRGPDPVQPLPEDGA